MSDSITVKVEGIKNLQKVIRKQNILKRALIRNLVSEIALNIQRRAKELVNVDTGRLRSSIRPLFFPGGLSAEVFTDVEYSVQQEFDEKRGKPFMRPAAEIEQKRFRRKLAVIIGK